MTKTGVLIAVNARLYDIFLMMTVRFFIYNNTIIVNTGMILLTLFLLSLHRNPASASWTLIQYLTWIQSIFKISRLYLHRMIFTLCRIDLYSKWQKATSHARSQHFFYVYIYKSIYDAYLFQYFVFYLVVLYVSLWPSLRLSHAYMCLYRLMGQLWPSRCRSSSSSLCYPSYHNYVWD